MKPSQLAVDALSIWRAGVEAVRPSQLIADKVQVAGTVMRIEDIEVDIRHVRRMVVVGAGKASGGLALEFERQVLPKLRRAKPDLEVVGWVNCPEGSVAEDCSKSEVRIFEARPAGVNEPTQKSMDGTQHILRLVADCDKRDLVVCLLSGGGSALLAAPISGVTLDDKRSVARLVAAAGGNIEQLNTVRRAISRVKGGGLARACQAGRLVTLIISDVLGDSLETIASGPTLAESSVDPRAALQVLADLSLDQDPRLSNVVRALEQGAPPRTVQPGLQVEHVILGNNADAVDAAGVKAVELGYRYVMEAAGRSEGDVSLVAEHAVHASLQLLSQGEVDCWISGGEPTVQLPKTGAVGRGGRNQHLALAVLQGMMKSGWPSRLSGARSLAFVSGGTDGEDGASPAAGAWFDADLQAAAMQLGLDPSHYLEAADSYTFFERAGGVIQTGPTGTNVCDLRIALART